MRIGFIRTMKAGPGIEAQKTVMKDAGLDPDDPRVQVFLDDRDKAIVSLKPGDELVIAAAECLGYPEVDTLNALAAVGARGASVYDAGTAQRIEWNHPEFQLVLDFALRAATRERKAIAAHARRSRRKSGNLGGIPAIKWDQEKLEKLRTMFAAGSGRQQMADELGVSRATIQRKLRELGLVQLQSR